MSLKIGSRRRCADAPMRGRADARLRGPAEYVMTHCDADAAQTGT
ncbi:hypothetical protein [Demequina lutea]|uniref:Uncharacterized protein n=1 Tax=Demequina lutea TaxID=431489 RepID=A0A7Y9ZBX0_9MICO|nr:hypothetical protein [Demequina lutea]NYI42562.1 hypothetical protein [Demequina lutea]